MIKSLTPQDHTSYKGQVEIYLPIILKIMTDINELRVCPICGKEFKPATKNQVYCSKQCKYVANYRKKKIERGINDRKLLELTICRCYKDDCKMYNNKFINNCSALQDINKKFIDNCSFYKHK